MQQKQERPTSQKEKARESIRSAPKGKVLLPGGAGGRARKLTKLGKFDEIKKKLEATGKLDLNDFDNTQDIGLFLDWYNQGISDKKKKRGDDDISEITKALARSIIKNPTYHFMR